MTRQRSQSASSAQQLAKCRRSPTVSMATAAGLHDPLQPPKALQDILLLAQSHYISHRYVQALALYKLAAEHHHSLPACSSLYALYTSTQTGSGLVRSDTKAVRILIHALRIWTARRWSSSRVAPSGPMRSRTQDDHDELEEYFAHPRKPTRQQHNQHQQRRSYSTGATRSIQPSKGQLMMAPPGNKDKALAQSMESVYRHPQFLNWRDEEDQAAEIQKESEGSEGESESCDGDCTDDEEDEECEGDQEDLDTDQDDIDDEDDDEEQEKEEEARRLGLATSEIEDIIQKICHMIQKGVLGLDEPVLVEAVSMLRKIERGLHQEAEARRAEGARSISLFTSSLSGGPSDEAARPAPLLLTQGIDLSFLDLGPDDGSSLLAQALPMGRSIRHQPGRNFTSPTPLTHSSLVSPPKHSPMNASIAKLSTKEQEAEYLLVCAIRIRVMFTLGWVHQQKGEYHYGAQAYGVCSEIPPTGKRHLDSLQHQANVQRWTCKAFEHKAQEQTEADRKRAEEVDDVYSEDVNAGHSQGRMVSGAATPTPIETKKSGSPATRSPPSRNTIGSSASSFFTSSQPSTTGRRHRPDISSPSSLSSSESESASTSIHGWPASVSAVSSFSAAIWSSGLFKSGSNKSSSSATSHPNSKVPVGLKIHTLKSLAFIETKDRHQHHHLHHHKQQQHKHKSQRGKTSSSDKKHQQQKQQQQQQTLTMTGHQKQITKCGHCGQRRALMPLCVCKKVRYCNLECRLAALEDHRSTCCHSSTSSSFGSVVVVSPGGGTMGIIGETESSDVGTLDPNVSVGPGVGL
ncbi:hypothetical protein BGX23_008930 [Mortierella sp. AD031]|nr:hypothetical protein BGX23_008930 [Mortierella sp. AD031]